MNKVKFFELDLENKDQAVIDMFSYKEKKDWPNGAIWENEDDVREDLATGFAPDEYFSFYIDDFGGVETKIG